MRDIKRIMLLVAIASAATLFVLLALPLLTGRIYADSDLANFFIPIRAFYRDCLCAGHDYRWLPYEFTGFYLHGASAAGLTHPANYLSYRFLPLEVALNVELLRNYAFLLLGTWWFLRRWSLPNSASVVGAVSFTFSGFTVMHFMHLSMIAAIAHLPFSLVALDFLLRGDTGRQIRLGALGSLLTATSLILVGHPHGAWICLFVDGLYVVWLGLAQRTYARLAAAFVIQVLAVASAGIQVVPTWESLQSSIRAAPPEGFRDTLAVSWHEVVELVHPYLFSAPRFPYLRVELATYAGSLAPIAVAWLLARRASIGSLWPLARAALCLALIGLMLSVGDAGGLYRVQGELPVLRLFRAPARYIAVTHAAVAVIVAIALVDMARGHALTARTRLAVSAVPVASVLLTVWVVQLEPESLGRDVALWPRIWIGPVIAAAMAAAVWGLARGYPIAAALLVVFTAADIGAYGLTYVRSTDIPKLEEFRSRTPPPPASPQYRNLGGPPALIMHDVRLAWGYVALYPKKELIDPVQLMKREAEQPERVRAALRVASVGWIGTAVEHPLPRARIVSRAQVSASVFEDLDSVDVDQVALVEHALHLDGGEVGTATIIHEVPGSIRIQASVPGRQLLVLSESYHPGWKWTVDGAAARAIRVYGDFMGVVLDRGRHDLELIFRPESYTYGAWASAVGMTLGILGCVLVPVPLRRSSPRPN